MRIYQSSLNYKTLELIADYVPFVKVNILRSFDLVNEQTFDIISSFPEYINSVILDSGVWFKYKNPQKYNDNAHNVRMYGEFVQKYGDKFDFYFNYDEDFREEYRDAYASKNNDNQRTLESMGLRPVPVLHLLDDELINYHIEQREQYPLVAIGSNQVGDAKFNAAVKRLYDNGVKVHGFRLGSSIRLVGLAAWSVDCSSHAQWTAGGRAVIFDKKNKKEVGISFRPFNNKGEVNDDFFQRHPLKDDFLEFLKEQVGVELEALIKDSNYRTLSNSIYYWWLERFVTCKNLLAPYNIVFDEPHFDCSNKMLANIFGQALNGEVPSD